MSGNVTLVSTYQEKYQITILRFWSSLWWTICPLKMLKGETHLLKLIKMAGRKKA